MSDEPEDDAVCVNCNTPLMNGFRCPECDLERLDMLEYDQLMDDGGEG